MQNFINQLSTVLEKKYILTQDDEKTPYLTDWRKRFTGKALAIVLPSNSHEVADIIKLCSEHQISIVPQGGNTGFCGGATPDSSGKQIILNLKRMNQVYEIDPANQTITLEAGCMYRTRLRNKVFYFPLV